MIVKYGSQTGKSENMEDFKAKNIVYVLRPLMSDVLSSS